MPLPGLVYRDGRPSSSQALAGREQEAIGDQLVLHFWYLKK